ncbi:Cystathionine beta-lyase [Altererythrobacter insulae]|nr:Cystathionine beta-lyase [Altererythrobacter insulae]
MSDDRGEHKPATKLVEAGRRKEWTGRVVNPPVVRASTHLYDSDAERKAGTGKNADGTFFYGRRGATTQWALAEALTAIEPGAHGTVLFPSGVAAIASALMAVLRPGDVLLISDNSYEPSRLMATGLLKKWGVEHRFFDPLNIDAYSAAFCDKTRAVWLESPGSLTMEVCDVPAMAAIAKKHGAVSLIDNTWATPLGFAPLEHGVDISVMSLTKHVSGHSDAMMGSASAGERWYRAMRLTSQQLGQVVSPDDASLMLRGLRTMQVRLEQSTKSALAIAEWLKTRPEVAHVLCPMLPGDNGYELWRRDFTGACGLFSFVLKGRDDAARARLVDNLELFGIGYSWGGFESLALPFDPAPIRTAASWPPSTWDEQDRLGVRLSIGLEDPDDLIADLAQGFEKMDNV